MNNDQHTMHEWAQRVLSRDPTVRVLAANCDRPPHLTATSGERQAETTTGNDLPSAS